MSLVVAIALGDSLNPSTIAPALFLASGERSRHGVLEFTISVFLVHLVGGALLALGPAQLLLSLLNELGHTTKQILETAAGVAMVIASCLVWHHRGRLAQKDLPDPNPQRKSSLLLDDPLVRLHPDRPEAGRSDSPRRRRRSAGVRALPLVWRGASSSSSASFDHLRRDRA